MQYALLPSFNSVAYQSRASTQIPDYKMSLGRIVLQLGGGLTKALISEIVVKVGSRVVFGPVSGTQLDLINSFRGQANHASFIAIDLTERNGLSVFAKEVGAIDLPSLRGEPVFVEVLNTQTTGGPPTLVGWAGFTGRQFVKDGKNDHQEQLIHKLLRYQVPSSGGTRMVWMPQFKGAIVKRVHFMYAGTDWTVSADGNLKTVEVKKNGVAIHDRVACLANRFLQLEQGLVPQTRDYVVDFCTDHVFSAAMATRDARALEFNLDLTAVDTVTAFAEVLDLPRNL